MNKHIYIKKAIVICVNLEDILLSKIYQIQVSGVSTGRGERLNGATRAGGGELFS